MAMMESLPVGTILMYDGSGWQDNVTLKGWYACVSANAGHQCPDLSERFVRGGVAPGAVGGANQKVVTEANMPAHNHDVSVDSHSHGFSGGSHTHGFGVPDHDHSFSGEVSVLIDQITLGKQDYYWTYIDHLAGASLYAWHNVFPAQRQGSVSGTVGSDGAHSGTTGSGGGGSVGNTAPGASSANKGGGEAFDNQPAYYSLIFIRKCYETANQSTLSDIADNFDDSGTVDDPAIKSMDGGDLESAFLFRDAGRL